MREKEKGTERDGSSRVVAREELLLLRPPTRSRGRGELVHAILFTYDSFRGKRHVEFCPLFKQRAEAKDIRKVLFYIYFT